MTCKKAALKLLSCGLGAREDEAEAIAWAIWALMEQARYEDADDPAMDLNAEDHSGKTFEVGDKVILISHGDNKNIYYEPEISTLGVVKAAGKDSCSVQWPNKSTVAGRDGRDDCWSVDNYKLKKIP